MLRVYDTSVKGKLKCSLDIHPHMILETKVQTIESGKKIHKTAPHPQDLRLSLQAIINLCIPLPVGKC